MSKAFKVLYVLTAVYLLARTVSFVFGIAAVRWLLWALLATYAAGTVMQFFGVGAP